MKQVIQNINFCAQCPFSNTVPDPDPHDSFNSDDMAILCSKMENTEQSKLQFNIVPGLRIISSGDRPYQIDKIKIPNWCPLPDAPSGN